MARKQTQVEAVYRVEELAKNANKLFDTTYECARAALENNGEKEITVEKAKKLVSAFQKKEVI